MAVGFDRDLGQEQCLDNICWDRSLDGLDSSFILGSYCLSSPTKGSRLTNALNATTQESLTGVRVVRYQCGSLSKWLQAENRAADLFVIVDVFDEPCHDSGIQVA